MLDIVSVFCSRDVGLLLLQARSISLYVEREQVGRTLCIWNDPLPMPEEFRGELSKELRGRPFELIDAVELGVDKDATAEDGWTTQQALKLLAARLVHTDNYLVLDAKNHFIRPISLREFISEDRRGLFSLVDLTSSESFQYCLRYFGVSTKRTENFGVLNVTPFLLSTQIVEDLIKELQEREGMSLAEVFLKHKNKLSEFLVYQVYVLSKGGTLSEIYSDLTTIRDEPLWVSTVEDSVSFDSWIMRVSCSQIKVLGIHWLACMAMSVSQVRRICEMWQRNGLVESLEDGLGIVDGVRRGLSDKDYEYWRKYLESGKIRAPDEPAVSVIIPVYNKGSYLKGCLESVLTQSLTDIEVICVNDASTDDSGKTLEEVAHRDHRVKVIRFETNRGAAAARNAGLSAARGEFVQFTDADDMLTVDGLRLLVERARKDNVDVVRGGVVGFHTEAPDTLEVLNIPQELSRFMPFDSETCWRPWWHTTYLFSRRFLQSQGLIYPELCSGEDPVFLAGVLSRASRMSSISDVIYRYRIMPLKAKGRATWRHLMDFLCHAEMVRSLFLKAFPDAWYRGYAPLLLPDIRNMLNEWKLTNSEREIAETAIERIFAWSESKTRAEGNVVRLLFMYNVCGLGGVETSIMNKMAALECRGVEVMALFQSLWGEGGWVAARHPGFLVEDEEEKRRQILRDWAPTAVVVIDSPWLIDAVGRSGIYCPIIFESHISDESAMERRVLPGIRDGRVSAVVVPSEFNRNRIRSVSSVLPPIRVISNPISSRRFRTDTDVDDSGYWGFPSTRRLLLWIGRIERQKNALEFVRICKALREQKLDVHCVIVGDAVDSGDYAESVHESAVDLGENIAFIARVPYEKMPNLYRQVAGSGGCMISTSVHESQPMIVLEAMACGCPVVVSDVGGVREVISDGVTGHVYPLGDIAEAVRMVKHILNDREYRETVVDSARQHVQMCHAPEIVAQAYLELLDEIGVISPPLGDYTRMETKTLSEERSQLQAGMVDSIMPQKLLNHALTEFFAERVPVAVRTAILPYRDIVSRVQLGFESSATVELEMRPKDDFTRSPDQCLNTIILDYRGQSRWLTIEVSMDWAELQLVDRYQVGIYARPNRPVGCRVALRIQRNDGTFKDFSICKLVLAPSDRAAHSHGHFQPPVADEFGSQSQPKLMFFMDSDADLQLVVDYLRVYFA